jgi:oxygen-independent coproporphyrinogen-3 oxidase
VIEDAASNGLVFTLLGLGGAGGAVFLDFFCPLCALLRPAAGHSLPHCPCRPDTRGMDVLTPELVRRYDRPGPRYTSYPTAAEFHDGVEGQAYAERLAAAAARPDEALGLYIHLPFCEERCSFCACNVVITKKREVNTRYLGILAREIRDVSARLGDRAKVRQLHWGGGTPTYLSCDEMIELDRVTREHFQLEPDREQAIEIDPRVTSFEQLAVLRELGFNRLSLGVQDFTPAVQVAVNRVQSYEDTRDQIAEARRLGFGSINVDLIYGLPLQTVESYTQSLQQVLSLRPDRVAAYSYAHMPWLKGNQKRVGDDDLPSPDVKLELFLAAREAFLGAGYVSIGMDHFALPEDEMGRAIQDGTLWRNFMGYTVKHAPDSVAFGVSAIGDVAGAFVQNHRKLSTYEKVVEEGGLPTERGYGLSPDDLVRRHVITALMCTFRVDFEELKERFGIDAPVYFASELQGLRALEEDGFVRLVDTDTPKGRIEVIGTGRMFVRNVCMLFDTYLEGHTKGATPRFSRTV